MKRHVELTDRLEVGLRHTPAVFFLGVMLDWGWEARDDCLAKRPWWALHILLGTWRPYVELRGKWRPFVNRAV